MRQISDDERSLVIHVSMWGSDGYPVHKVGSRHWAWSYRSINGPPVVFTTKRECVNSFEEFLDVLYEALGEADKARAIANLR
jgi:hypothetical protein